MDSSLFDNGPDRYAEWCAGVRDEFRTVAWRHYRSNRRAAGLRRAQPSGRARSGRKLTGLRLDTRIARFVGAFGSG